MNQTTQQAQMLSILADQAMHCKRCKLCTTRNKVVFGEGNPDADLIFIGEGPGREEDRQGRPFVGRAGELLTRIIESGMGLQRNEVYIANVVKCRPTVELAMQRDRPPDEEETSACSPFLLKQIELINPKALVTLGNPATRFILKTKTGITKLRGNWAKFGNIPVMPTFHPSYVLRNGGEKSPLRREVWSDIQQVMALLNGK